MPSRREKELSCLSFLNILKHPFVFELMNLNLVTPYNLFQQPLKHCVLQEVSN